MQDSSIEFRNDKIERNGEIHKIIISINFGSIVKNTIKFLFLNFSMVYDVKRFYCSETFISSRIHELHYFSFVISLMQFPEIKRRSFVRSGMHQSVMQRFGGSQSHFQADISHTDFLQQPCVCRLLILNSLNSWKEYLLC
jgi:hypothetical protein